MADIDFVKRDQGGVNARIIARESKADFRRVEAASVKLKASFASAEGKRMFIRYFNTFQLSSHFISVISRTRLNHDDVTKVEMLIRAQTEKVTEELNKAIDGAEALFTNHGITSVATYDTVPLDLEVGVLSSSSRRYLDVLTKLDQLMPLLQTLEIHEVITTQAVDIERAALKRKVRDVANGARNLATRLRREMNALDTHRGRNLPKRMTMAEHRCRQPCLRRRMLHLALNPSLTSPLPRSRRGTAIRSLPSSPSPRVFPTESGRVSGHFPRSGMLRVLARLASRPRVASAVRNAPASTRLPGLAVRRSRHLPPGNTFP